MPSHNEGMPYALLEAMAAGCAVVAFAVGGIPEAISDPKVGVLIQPGDVQALATTIMRMAEDPAAIAAFGRAAASHVEQHFTLETRLHAIRRAYGLSEDAGETTPALER